MILTVELNIDAADEDAIKASLFEWYLNHEISMGGIVFVDPSKEVDIL